MRPPHLIALLALPLGCCKSAGSLQVSAPATGATPAASPPVSAVWVADLGNGTYQNSVLHADYSDLDVVRVGRDYYLTASSFQDISGLPILHSRDLVNWQLLSYELPRQQPAAVFDVPQHGYGVWAPCLRYHQGTFHLFWGDPDYGTYMVQAARATGPRSAPALMLGGRGLIDPAPFWDDAGRHISSCHANGNHTTKGPKLYRRGGCYYVLAPGGGVATGWQLALRSRSLYDPWESKKVIDQGATVINGPHQGAWVNSPDGKKDCFLHFQYKGLYDYVLPFYPISWKNKWPAIGTDGDGTGQPVASCRKLAVGRAYPRATPPATDEFDAASLGWQWQRPANDRVQWAALLRGTGHLRLFAIPAPAGANNPWPLSNLLLQKLPAPGFAATTKLAFTPEWGVWTGKQAGLLVMDSNYACMATRQTAGGFCVAQARCLDAPNGTPEQVIDEPALPANTAYLRVQVSVPSATCHFSLDRQSFRPLGEFFQAKLEQWVEAKVNLLCIALTESYADAD